MSDSECLSDEEHEREERKAREARSKAKPVKRALRNMNDGKDPVTVDELLALAARLWRHRDVIGEGRLDLARVAPRMPGPEITLLLALEGKEWLLAECVFGYDGFMISRWHDLAKGIAEAWRTLSEDQRAAIKPFLSPADVFDAALGGPPEPTWDDVSAAVNT